MTADLAHHPILPPPVAPRTAATVEPVRASVVRRAVGSIPGLGFLKRRKKDEAFIPPRPIQQIQPPGLALASEDQPVRVKVTVTPSGEVESAELLSRNIQPAAARAAVEAARKWRFAPATMDEKPVSSQIILSFSVSHGSSKGI
jgi:TonB family protein